MMPCNMAIEQEYCAYVICKQAIGFNLHYGYGWHTKSKSSEDRVWSKSLDVNAFDVILKGFVVCSTTLSYCTVDVI